MRLLVKAKSERDFINSAIKEGCERVVVQPLVKARHFAKASRIGISGFYQYLLKISASTESMDRKVISKKPVFERTADNTWNEDEKQKCRIMVFLHGEKEVEELRRKLPGATVTFASLEGEPIDLRQVHSDAAKYGVSIP